MKMGDLVRTVKKICEPMVGVDKIGIVVSDRPRIVEGDDELIFVLIDGQQYLEYMRNLEPLDAQD